MLLTVNGPTVTVDGSARYIYESWDIARALKGKHTLLVYNTEALTSSVIVTLKAGDIIVRTDSENLKSLLKELGVRTWHLPSI